MKTNPLLPFCALVAALASVAKADDPKPGDNARLPNPQIELDSTFFTISPAAAERLGLIPGAADLAPKCSGILSASASEKLKQTLRAEKSVMLLSSPRVTTISGQHAVVEVIREFRYPTAVAEGKESDGNLVPTKFETVNTGVSLEVAPVLAAEDVIDLETFARLTDFNRFVAYEGGRTHDPEPIPKGGFAQPLFDSMWNSLSVSLRPGQTLLLDGSEWIGASRLNIERLMNPRAAKPAADTKADPQLLFVTVTARLASPRAELAGPMTEAGPVEITAELVSISRDRLPAGVWKDVVMAPGAGTPTIAGSLTPSQLQDFRKAVIANSGGEHSAAPKKVITPGGSYSLEATGLLRYPDKNAKTGEGGKPVEVAKPEMERMDFWLEVKPRGFHAGSIDLAIKSSQTTAAASNEEAALESLAGMASAKWKFDDHSAAEARKSPPPDNVTVNILDASTVVFVRATEGREDHVQFVLITAKMTDADARAKADARKWPSASPVPGKPGFVTSPYKPDAGFIDVRGFPKGSQVKDPYTGQTFLVP